MELNESHYRQIEKLLPRQRGNVKIDNRQMLQALIYRCQNGCSWRALPPSLGPWHSISMRFNRWARRYDKLDVMFTAFIWLACICIFSRSVNTP